MIALGLSTEVVNVWMNDPGFGAHKVTSLPHGAAVLCISTFGPYIATAAADKVVRLWRSTDAGKSYTQAAVAEQRDDVRCLHLSGERLVTGSLERCARLYEVKGASLVGPMASVHHAAEITCVLVIPDGFVTGGGDKMVRIWDEAGVWLLK